MQVETLEIVMEMEASSVGDSHAVVQQIQNQLTMLTLELQDLKKGKEFRPEISKVWCMTCKAEGHYKDQCPIFRDYIATGAPNLVNPGLWCEICRK